MSKILVVAAHPDDETLGCGGTLLRHKAEGDEINWLIATTMEESGGFSQKEILAREEEVKSVGDRYGFRKIERLNIPAAKIDGIPVHELVKKIAISFNDVKPEILYLPFNGDPHSDHRSIFEAAYSCTKNFRFPFIKKILMMETLSETEFAPSLKESFFTPNHFVDITGFLKKKIKIMKLYKSEMKKHPFPRNEKNMEALAVFRGASAGCSFAESFMVLKEIR